jgi:16S rRNA (cytidine1402-2'-O)-methyltransferase
MNEKNAIEAALYIVPTPIGNLDDITLRAMNILKDADIIASEDTRRTGQLLKSLEIPHKKFISYHDYNEREKAEQIAGLIEQGQSVALVSDAGTPGISDPAYRLINACIERQIKLIPLPGATAFIPALLASGFGTDKFAFFGFPPHKKGRKKFIQMIADADITAILYESPFRVIKLINEMSDAGMQDQRICIAREITKLHEEFIRGTVAECSEILKEHKNIKGEFVVVVESRKD